jgi:MFS family permease
VRQQQWRLRSELSSLIAADSHAPAHRVGWRFVLVYALAYTGTWIALLTPVLITISLKIRQLTPGEAAGNHSLVLSVGAFFALVSNPFFGRLSDRTTSRFGMRRPWLICGVLGGAIALLIVARADSVAAVLAGWCLAQLSFNAVLAALVAVLPDQVPAQQRGTVAGVLGTCMPLGQLAGTFVVQSVPESTLAMFMVPALIGAAAILLLAVTLVDRRLDRAQPVRDTVSWYWVSPRRYPDFAWAWLSRFLVVLGTAFLTTYQPFYLTEKLGLPQSAVRGLIFHSMLVQASMVIVLSLLGGRVSDALQRRKAFVLGGAIVYAIGLWIIALADSYAMFLVGMAATGVGHGLYFGVDLALVTEVLPDRERDAAKDLGILNVTNALPQMVAPALAPAILALSGGDYAWLFFAAGAIALAGSIAILPLKSVR